MPAVARTAVAFALLLAAGPLFAQPPGFGGFGREEPDGPAAAPAGVVRYALSNARVTSVETPFGVQDVFQVDWTRTAPGSGSVTLQVWEGQPKGFVKHGYSDTLPNSDEETSGTVNMSLGRFGGGGLADTKNLEAYAVTPAAGLFDTEFLVSNVLSIGSVRDPTSARGLTAEERDRLQAITPPGAPPAGFALVTDQTPLLPGMPVKFGEQGEWVDAELLALGPNRAAVRRADEEAKFGKVRPRSVDYQDGWMAVGAAVLARAEAAPERFEPSVRVQPGGSLPLPDDAEPLPRAEGGGIDLPAGTPLLVEHAGDWVKVVLRAAYGEDRVLVRDGLGRDANEAVKPVAEAAIQTSTLARLKDPATVERFEANAEQWGDPPVNVDDSARTTDEQLARRPKVDLEDGRFPKPEGAPDGRLENAPIRLKLPARTVKVPKDLFLPDGTEVGVCGLLRWSTTKVVGAGGADFVCTRNFGDSDVFNKYYIRSQLIIDTDTVRRLRALPEPVAGDPAPDAETPGGDMNGGTPAEPESAAWVDAAGNPIPADKIQDRPIDVPLPAGSQILPDRLTVPRGTKLRGQWRRGLTPATVLEPSSTGPVKVRWDRYGDLFDGWVPRGQLVIEIAAAQALKE